MNGAESLVETLNHNGINVCFANPGTSEMHFVAALDGNPDVRGVLGLFEGVVTGAADGFARMADKPAATLLHLGPGLANGLAGLHNANRGRSSMVNIVGDHATYHKALDAPLTSDIEGAARPFSHWVRTSTSANAVAVDAADAISYSLPGRVSTLILPADTAWSAADKYATPPTAREPEAPNIDSEAVTAAAKRLADRGSTTALLLGGKALRVQQLELAAQIAAATGATVLSETFAARTERGAGRPVTTKIPYPVDAAVEMLGSFDAVILIEAKPPVAFFAYPDKPSILTSPTTAFVNLCPIEGDSSESLEALLDEISGPAPSQRRAPLADLSTAPMPSGTITSGKLAAWLSNAIPENAIVLDESLTTGWDFFRQTASSKPHDYLSGTGGAIGWALPVAIGAAIAAPERKVIALEGDGSAMYNVQSLWTYAREQIDVVVLVFANRKYQILHNEMANVGVPEISAKASQLLDIDSPTIDWVAVSTGMGVPAQRVETIEELRTTFTTAIAEPGPFFIEVLC